MAFNWGTAVAGLTADLRNLASADIVKRRLVESIRQNRDRRVFQSEGSFSFTLAESVADYAPGDDAGGAGSAGDFLPTDFMEPIGEVCAQEVDSETKTELVRVTAATMERLRATDSSEAQTPRAWDIYGGKLRVYPTPDDSATVLSGRYQVDLGIPEARYVSGAWKFYEPNGSTTELTDAYTSGWFTFHNLDAVLAYAKCLLWTDLKDYQSANRWLAIWGERIAAIQDETEGMHGPPMIEPWP